MRIGAWILIIAGLVLAVVSAVTAYSPKTSLSEDKLRSDSGAPLILAAPAGRATAPATAPAGTIVPLARAGEPLTPQLLAQLRAGDQTRVRVKEFSISRWSEWWLFAIGCFGMLGGAMLIRREDARQLVLGADGKAEQDESAEQALQSLRRELDELRGALGAIAETRDVGHSRGDADSRLGLIVDRVGQMTAEHVPPFIAARPTLVSRLGLAGYAQLMDRFAAAERKLHRAWSAAADAYPEEAIECLSESAILLNEAAERMPR